MTSKSAISILFCAMGLCLLAGWACAEEQDQYWAWGWGAYGLGVRGSEGVLDGARFDWTFICFGNDPADQRAVDACNEILALNPKHTFVIRVWPIMGLGDCAENNHQATLFHYFYAPGVKEKLLAETRRQIELIVKGIPNPEAVVGATFLEELPGHFTSCPFGDAWKNWKQGDPLPWDVKRFQKEIETELGAPFDLRNEQHRLWWGRKYTQAITEIGQTMREALGGKLVIYYQSTCYSSMDCAGGAPRGEAPAVKPEADPQFVPVYYKDIVKQGGADGFFGYPNSAEIWAQQTQRPAQALHCPIFSQISVPPFMRLCTMEENVALARWQYPLNLGSFLFTDTGRRTHAWNEARYLDDTFWTGLDHLRRLGWEYKINMDVVARGLSPVVALDYSLAGVKRGDFFHVQAQVWNRRHPSWYGGAIEQATLTGVTATLKLPDGFSLPTDKSGGETLPLGDIAPHDARVADWWVQLAKDEATIPADQAIQIAVATSDGAQGAAASSAADQAVPALQEHLLCRSGDRWIEPAYRLTDYRAVVELCSLGPEILCPALECAGRRVTYRDTLRPNTRLVIGPGAKAMLFEEPLFDEDVRHFAPNKQGPDGAVEFTAEYLVFRTSSVPVRCGERYRLRVTGWAKDGGNCLVVARFQGTEGGKKTDKDCTALANCFTDQSSTAESGEIVVPAFDEGAVTMLLFFYRFQSKGTVYYQSFDCHRADSSPDGTDVSARLEGALADLAPPVTVWTYTDLSDPDPSGGAKLRVRFIDPAKD